MKNIWIFLVVVVYLVASIGIPATVIYFGEGQWAIGSVVLTILAYPKARDLVKVLLGKEDKTCER